MNNKTNPVHELREKMGRFNAWERTYIRRLSEEERFRQFVELFELAMSSDAATVEKAHHEHLQQLSRIARASQKQKS
ncbi:MAG: hypothetical protein OQK67_02385 [Chlorobium sp.]|nr:hypothetical protein [Chlorobium phaeobacteroides]MCW8795890.1 hypothetical protein [Chlorobium sp.]MCW8815115.1 hypothetical protein [Chlorobium sp.]MCW8820380.1 hypothetical protein [Ignavibacteriaceae bacterium]